MMMMYDFFFPVIPLFSNLALIILSYPVIIVIISDLLC